MGAQNGDTRETLVVCQSNQGMEIRAALVRLTRLVAVFEIYQTAAVLRTSEVLTDFKILTHDRAIYSGRAIVRSLVNTGVVAVCEVALDEASWMDVAFASPVDNNGQLSREFEGFMRDWQKLYRILPEYKVVIADMQSFLADLRLWLDQVELGIRSSPTGDRPKLEKDVAIQLQTSVVPIINELFNRFEEVSLRVDEECRPAHMLFGRRQLHPLLLSSPFVYRTYAKPLGYAGDYEMVNMMFRDPCEGGSLFAKMINAYALQLAPIIAHRNRISYLRDRLTQEARRVVQQGRSLRLFNLGCGPAQEVQQFMAGATFSDQSEMVLTDFNDETLAHTTAVLSEARQRYGHRTRIQLVKKTAHQLLKQSERTVQRPRSELYDLIYCAGLFDYLSDKVCRKLMDVFYDMLAPGGTVVTTNVDVHPSRNEMEYFLEWHLIHRNTEQMKSLAPRQANPENIRLVRDPTGVNIFMEITRDGGEG